MTSKVYLDFVTPVDAASLNDFNTATYTTVPANTAAILTETNARIAADNLKGALTSPLSQFAATTSAQLASVLTDETGTGVVVFNTTPTLITPSIGAATGTSLVLTSTLSATQLTSTIATGTAPLVITSTTEVANLKAATASALSNTASTKLPAITGTVAANALTIGASSIYLDFRSATLGNGAISTINAAPASLVVPSTATLGTISAQISRLVVLEMNNAGVAELAVVNIAGGNNLDETTLISTTAIIAGSNAANVIYSTTARTSLPFRVVGYIESTQATAGTWATAPSTIQGAGGNALTAMSSLGYGQTWQNVTASRAAATTYYNTTGKPIQVSISVAEYTTTSATSIFVVNGVTVANLIQDSGAAAFVSDTVCVIIPSGASYSLSSALGGIRVWSELR